MKKETVKIEDVATCTVVVDIAEGVVVVDTEESPEGEEITQVVIQSIEVDEDYRRQGYGSQILDMSIAKAKAMAKELGLDCFYIVANPTDENWSVADLCDFYEDHGFNVVDCEAECPVLRYEM